MGEQMSQLIPVELIEKKILLIHGQKVMLDSDLAELYGVTTDRVNHHRLKPVASGYGYKPD